MLSTSLRSCCAILLLLSAAARGAEESPAWAKAWHKPPPTADETRQFLHELAQYVVDHHMKKDRSSPQCGMVYEYFDVTRQGQFDQFVQGEALDTMHDGAWLAAAMVNAYRATGDAYYKEVLTQWQLPFYLKMLNHSDELFTSEHNHARADRQGTWKDAKEWLLQGREKGFVPYYWDDGGSVSLDMRNSKQALLSYPGFDRFAHTSTANPEYCLDGYSLGSSNHLAQDLGVMLQQAWLLLKDSSDAADQKQAAEVALAAKNLHECRMRHHGYIPMCVAPAALANHDAELMKHVPAQDDWKIAAPANHYVQALYSFKPGQKVSLPGFADDQEYQYYYGLARHGGQLPRPLAFKVIYDAYTQPLLYRYYSDDAEVPPGINRFDLHPYSCVDGKLTDYRSDRKGPGGKPRPIGSRMGPQNMVCTGWALQALKAYPGIWDDFRRGQSSNDLRVRINDMPNDVGSFDKMVYQFGGIEIVTESHWDKLWLDVRKRADELIIKVFSQPDGKGNYAEVTCKWDQPATAQNAKGENLLVDVGQTKRGFLIQLPYTVEKNQSSWTNVIEHGRYSIQIGDTVRNVYLASDEDQVKEWLKRELGGGLRTWQAIFKQYGYIPTGIDAGANWQNFSDCGGYAHLISAASQWLLYLEGKRDWEEHYVPAVGQKQVALAVADEKEQEADKEQERIKRWEMAIKAFEEQDAKTPPPANPVVFVGSSSIRMWKVADSFPDLAALNRGFGGSHLADSVYYADRIVTKYKPRVVVLYAGDNDLGAGKSPEKVAGDFAAFIKKVRAELPDTKIVYVGIKPSIARWKLIDKVREANRQMKTIAEANKNVVFLNVEPPMLGEDGQPRKELFIKDGLHMTEEGYKIWTSLLKPHL